MAFSEFSLSEHERLVTILATNDLHGGIEPTQNKEGGVVGGMDFWAGAAAAIREGLKTQYGADRSGVLLLDAGDQIQGTLISNYREGRPVFAAMNGALYDAVVVGNHDYDFGPKGWRQDRVVPGKGDQDRRGALKQLARSAQFALLSANTYYKDSIVDRDGRAVEVRGEGCVQEAGGAGPIDWKRAKRIEIFKPWLIKEVAGVQVALIGLDLEQTPRTTTLENVSDLCFRELEASYLDAVDEMTASGTPADLFVLIVHDGNTKTEFPITKLVQKITKARPNSLHAVVAGHTHFYNKVVEQGVPIIQSGSGGKAFGRIDLVWDASARRLVDSKRRLWASLPLEHSQCASYMSVFCKALPDGGVAYEGVRVLPDAKVQQILKAARKKVSKLADRKLGVAEKRLTRDRIAESPLADGMTDALLAVAKAKPAKPPLPGQIPEIAFLNSSGLREDIEQGEVTYEDLFEVLPFSNHAVVLSPLPIEKLKALLARSVQTCGAYGALLQSGLRVTFERDCRLPAQGGRNVDGRDVLARLLRVETLSGDLLIENGNTLPAQDKRVFSVVTLDFLADGGSGYADFVGVPKVKDLGILREKLTKKFLAKPALFKGEMDGRWKDLRAED